MKIPQEILSFLLNRIGSWTNSRFDQHARYEFGDEATDEFLAWLAANNVEWRKP